MASYAYAVALGSNQGDRLAHLSAARQFLSSPPVGDPGIPVHASPVYRTEPVGCPPGAPPFLNAVVAFRSHLEPHALLARILEFEHEAGRSPAVERAPNAPRPIDLDILLAAEIVLDSPALTLPHPRLHLRRFVLQPLADVLPNRIIPGLGTSASSLLAGLQCDEPPLTLVLPADQW
ncbi:2-amino-4-hydroxy-6-hydroxymethyldihydropteridinediphosphokinase [soil metagenome]